MKLVAEPPKLNFAFLFGCLFVLERSDSGQVACRCCRSTLSSVQVAGVCGSFPSFPKLEDQTASQKSPVEPGFSTGDRVRKFGPFFVFVLARAHPCIQGPSNPRPHSSSQ